MLEYGQLLHGEAVAIGMQCAARLAAARGMVDNAFVQRQENLLNALGLPTAMPTVDPQRVWETLCTDKKANRDGVRFVLPQQMGRVELVGPVTREEALACLG